MIVCFSYTPLQSMFNWMPNFSKVKSYIWDSGLDCYTRMVTDGFSTAAASGNIPSMEFWLKRGAVLEGNNTNPKNFTPLQLAVYNKKYEAAEFLLQKGAILHNNKSNSGVMLQEQIITRGDQKMLKLLLQHKVIIDKGATPLLTLAEQEGRDMVIILRDHGMSLSKKPGNFFKRLTNRELTGKFSSKK